MSKLWGGRFAETTEALVEEYTESVSFDRALYAADIAGSRAHAAMLAAVGVLTADEARAIREGLDAVKAEIESGSFTFLTEREDVHMNIEARLTEIIGEAGKKLHTGRSRNDQVGLDFRIHTAARLTAWREGLRRLVAVLAQRAEEHRETLLPGCTHMQPGSSSAGLLRHVHARCRAHRRRP